MTERTDVSVRRLLEKDNRDGFESGSVELDRFFKLYAGQNQFRHHIGVTYIAETAEGIAGFATVSTGELTAESISHATRRQLPHYPLPVLRLARLAVDVRFKGRGIGKLLLKYVLLLAVEIGDSAGCCGVVVDAKEDAVEFYRQFGFMVLEVGRGVLGDRPEPTPMFLPLKEVKDALGR